MYSYTDPDLCLRSAVYDGVYHTPLGRFSMVDISTIGVVSVPKRGRRWKRLAESFPKTCGLVSAPSWLSSNRAWNTASGWYDIPGTPSYKVVGWPNWGVLDGPAATRSCNVSNSDDSSVFFCVVRSAAAVKSVGQTVKYCCHSTLSSHVTYSYYRYDTYRYEYIDY